MKNKSKVNKNNNVALRHDLRDPIKMEGHFYNTYFYFCHISSVADLEYWIWGSQNTSAIFFLFYIKIINMKINSK